MNYMLSYDLNKADKNYDGLIEKIKEISTQWCSPCKSTWIIQSDLLNAESVFKQLANQIDSNDHLIVAGFERDLYGAVSKENTDRLMRNFK